MSRLKLFTRLPTCVFSRGYVECPPCQRKGLILGMYEACDEKDFRVTEATARYDKCVNCKLRELLKGTRIKRGHAHVFGGLNDDFAYVAMAGLGPESAGYDPVENIDMCKENIREAAGAGAKALQEMGISCIYTDAFTNAEAAAEGSQLAVWRYNDWRTKDDKPPNTKVELYDSEDLQYWLKGTISTESQNMARWISECPANLMTPSLFTQMAIEYLCPCGIEVDVKDRDWMEVNHFTAFLAMARGSCQPPMVMELRYCGGKQNERPVVLCGKASTFDSGGLNLAPSEGMSQYRADVAGGAAVVGIMKAAARLSLPINIVGLLALYENMPSGLALKQGDVVQSLNGKTIRVDDPSHDGRVVMSDCICYSQKYRPAFIVTLSTSSSGLTDSLGNPPNGVFTTSDICWEELRRAGSYTGDRVWRLPLFKCFRSRITNYDGVDVVNTGHGKGGGPCLSAAFIMEFVPIESDLVYMDLSATGTLALGAGMNYIRRGTMSGRPVRTVVQFLYQLACPNEMKDDC